jgi:hypothetical protein
MRVTVPILLLLVGFATSAYAQDICASKIDVSVNEVSKSQFDIALKSSESIANAKVQLYDLYQGKVIQEKTVQIGFGESEVVFTKVKPSRYTIVVKYDGCEKGKTLGGIGGITVGEI